jgi:hypothetical protein
MTNAPELPGAKKRSLIVSSRMDLKEGLGIDRSPAPSILGFQLEWFWKREVTTYSVVSDNKATKSNGQIKCNGGWMGHLITSIPHSEVITPFSIARWENPCEPRHPLGYGSQPLKAAGCNGTAQRRYGESSIDYGLHNTRILSWRRGRIAEAIIIIIHTASN